MDGLNDFELLKDECYHKCQKVYTIIKNSYNIRYLNEN